MRHDDRHVRKIHSDVIDEHRVAVLQPDAAAAGHTGADAAVPGVEQHGQFCFGEDFVERVRHPIVWRKRLQRRVQLEAANAAARDETLRLAHALGAARRVDAGKRDRDVGVLGGKRRHLVVRDHRPSRQLLVHRKDDAADIA